MPAATQPATLFPSPPHGLESLIDMYPRRERSALTEELQAFQVPNQKPSGDCWDSAGNRRIYMLSHSSSSCENNEKDYEKFIVKSLENTGQHSIYVFHPKGWYSTYQDSRGY